MSRFTQEYTRQVRAGLKINHGVDQVAHCALGLTGEAGEVADLVKKSQYTNPKPLTHETIGLELGDALWYLTALADMYGLTLEDLMYRNIEKLEARHKGGWFDGRNEGYSLSKLIGPKGAWMNEEMAV
jgi:NTP pyrophosphatase (non-canonical NTP hydrolase)